MATAAVTGELGASVDEVWKLVGDFVGMVQAFGLPTEVEGEGIGQIRTIQMGDIRTVERLEELDDDGKRLVYSIIESPMPLVDYRATIALSPAGEGRTRVDWSSTFDVAPGTTDEAAVEMVEGIYHGGIAGLQGRFGS
jgi:hypothetical protein